MKSLLGILLILSSINVASAACSSYSFVPFVNDGYTRPLTNVVAESYRIRDHGHFFYIFAESVDYAGSSFTCKEIRYLDGTTSADDDVRRDEVYRFLKLSMTLGYKLSFGNTYSNGGAVFLNGLQEISVSKP